MKAKTTKAATIETLRKDAWKWRAMRSSLSKYLKALDREPVDKTEVNLRTAVVMASLASLWDASDDEAVSEWEQFQALAAAERSSS